MARGFGNSPTPPEFVYMSVVNGADASGLRKGGGKNDMRCLQQTVRAADWDHVANPGEGELVGCKLTAVVIGFRTPDKRARANATNCPTPATSRCAGALGW